MNFVKIDFKTNFLKHRGTWFYLRYIWFHGILRLIIKVFYCNADWWFLVEVVDVELLYYHVIQPWLILNKRSIRIKRSVSPIYSTAKEGHSVTETFYFVPCEVSAALYPLLYWLHYHGWLTRWIKWGACDVGEAKEGLENELWHRWSNGRVGEWAVT